MRWCIRRRALVTALAALAGCVNLTAPPRPTVAPGDAGDGPVGDRPAEESREGGSPTDPIVTGKPCLHSGQCDSGFCVDGVCCVAECAGRCHSCKVPGREGMCLPTPAGEDFRSECVQALPDTCQQDGFCDGAGACRRYPAGSQCSPVSCTGSTEQGAGTCDGNGLCQPGTSRSCAPLVCNQGSCGTACTSDAQCLTGAFCESTSCRPKRAPGIACTTAAQCASGSCVQGVCCDSACTQPCHSCKLPGSEGRCTPAPAGTDPRQECPPGEAAACGNTGECDGTGGCQLQPAGTVCVASSCTANIETAARTCNGLGGCVAAETRDCAPYLCGTTSCATACGSDAQCRPGYTCSGSICRAIVPDAAPPDPGPPVLVLDDFTDSNLRSNNLGGVVTWDNQVVSLVNGEQKFVWNGASVFQDFIEVFRSNWCEYNLTGYTRLRFRMRSSVAGKRVAIYLGIGNGRCGVDRVHLLTTITLTTAMTTYDLNLSSLVRDKVLTVELTPTTTDSTAYFVDDLVLVP